MRRLALPIATLLGTVLATAPVDAASSVREVQPYTRWKNEPAENSCMIRRGFGSAEDLFIVQIEQFAPGDSFQLVLTGKWLEGLEMPDKFAIAYGRDGPPHRLTKYLHGSTQDGIPSVFIHKSALRIADMGPLGLLADSSPELAQAATEIDITRKNRTLRLLTGSLAPAFQALRDCTDKLLRKWGLDPAQQANLSRRVQPLESPGMWLGSIDYPLFALGQGEQALVNFRLIVGPDGKPTTCAIASAYAVPAFKEATCQQIMVRARFMPALDGAGRPVASYYVNSVQWVIPH